MLNLPTFGEVTSSIGTSIGSITNPINRNLSDFGNNINRNLGDVRSYIENVFSPPPPNYVPTDFSGLTSKWDQLQKDIGGRFLQQNVQDVASQSAQGMGMGMQALGQKGGLGIGAQNRMQQQSKWDVAQQSALANQAAQQMGTQFGLNKIMGIDLPVLQGQEMAAAQKAAADASYRSPLQDLIEMGATAAGTAIGGTFGGPGGAIAGMQLGRGLGGGLARGIGNRR